MLLAGSARGTTLTEVLARVYQANPTLQADRAGLRALDEDVRAARAGGRPAIIAEGNLTHSALDVDGTGGVIGARVNQSLFRGGRVTNSVRAAAANVRAGREALRLSENQIFLETVQSYADVLRDREITRLNKELVANLERQVQLERRRLELGERTRTDVTQAEARLANARSTSIVASATEQSSAERFQLLAGSLPSSLEPLPGPKQMPPSRDAALATALANNPEVQRTVYGEEAARYLVRVAQSARMPTLDASAAVSKRDEIVQILDRKLNQELATFQLVLTVPLYQGGSEFAAIRRAKHVNNVRRLEIEEAVRRATVDTNVAWDSYVATSSAVLANRQAVALTEQALVGVRREALLGSRTTIDVLDAERDLRDARVTLASSQRDASVAAYSLLAAMGQLTATNLSLPVTLYDPEAPMGGSGDSGARVVP